MYDRSWSIFVLQISSFADFFLTGNFINTSNTESYQQKSDFYGFNL